MPSTPRIQMFQRPFPSANIALVNGPRPILIDSGFGTEIAETLRLLSAAGVPPQRLHLVANTHSHCDHVGGNHHLQQALGIPIAASAPEAALINQRHPAACDADFLVQPLEPYQVDRILTPGDELETGEVLLQVLDTPGHMPGHLSFYAPAERVLILGDVLHADDVAWLNLCTSGPAVIDQMLTTLDRLAQLPVAWACSGHGPAIQDFPGALLQARRRYEKWRTEPQKIGWHAVKRILGYALMLEEGMTQERLREYLLAAPWFQQHSRLVFGLEPAEFVEPLLAEMLRAGAAVWREGRLMSATAYRQLPPGWVRPQMRPRHWPPAAPI